MDLFLLQVRNINKNDWKDILDLENNMYIRYIFIVIINLRPVRSF